MSVIVFNFCIRKLQASVGMALRAVPKMKKFGDALEMSPYHV